MEEPSVGAGEERVGGVLGEEEQEALGRDARVAVEVDLGDEGVRDGVSAHVYLLGRRGAGGEPVSHPLVTEVYLDGDARFATQGFLLFLSEHSAYALLSGPDGRIFHTSDVPLVDALVSKLQNLYDLQPL